jgi:hypothetical protein
MIYFFSKDEQLLALETIQHFNHLLNGYWLHFHWFEIVKAVKLNTGLYLVSWLRMSGVIFALPKCLHHGVYRDPSPLFFTLNVSKPRYVKEAYHSDSTNKKF